MPSVIRSLIAGALRYTLTDAPHGESKYTLQTHRDGRVVARMGFDSICGADLLLESLGAAEPARDPAYEAVAHASGVARSHGNHDAYAVLVRLLEAYDDPEALADIAMLVATSERKAVPA